MTQYLTPGMTSLLRHALEPVFWHTYTRTPRLPATTLDADEEPIWVDGDPVTNQPCLFQNQGRSVIGPNGLVEVNVPVIIVPYTDPLDVGDKVSDVVSTDPKTGAVTVVFQGPSMVENATAVAPELGGPLLTQALLRSIEEI